MTEMMKKIINGLLIGLFVFLSTGCEKDWLDRKPKDLVLEEQVWNDPDMILSLLANYYNRLEVDMSVDDNWRRMAIYDDAMWSGQMNNEGYYNDMASYGGSEWRLWNYGLIRDINLALESLEEYAVELDENTKLAFNAELRFIRAMNYFELVKRMGGVPLVTEQLIYDFSGDPSYLRQPRAKEHEVYDFIADELDEIMDVIGNEGSQTRANRYTCLALKSRAMLYAGSLAKYNNEMPVPIETDGGEVGIPASMADAYYTASLEASRELINESPYELYEINPHLGENFYEVTYNEAANPEVIFAKDFSTAVDKRHWFAYDNIARGIREDNLASSTVTPVLNLVEAFQYLDNSSGELVTHLPDQSDYIYYDNLEDIFANKDWRLYGTVIYPGTSFKGLPVEIQAGVKEWDPVAGEYNTYEGSDLATKYSDGGLLTGSSGPHRSMQEVSNTGFYLRKFIDSDPGSSTRGIRSDNWWVWFRLGEIYLNAAEAALEVSTEAEALGYVNRLRERAGFPPNSLTSFTLDDLINERRVELAFEDHRVWDLKRWRIAHEVWDGDPSNPNAMLYALYPYRVIHPTDPTKDGKYVFEKMVAPRFRSPRFFQMQNYYSSISQSVIDNNPLIIQNPFH